jgi:hypothetical protein
MSQTQDRDRNVIDQALKNYQKLVAAGRIPKPATVPPRDSGPRQVK